MSATAIVLFVFLLPGTVFSYSLYSSGYYANYPFKGENANITNIFYFNLTYEGSHFPVHIVNETEITISVSGLENKTLYNKTSSINGSETDFFSIYYPIFTPAFLVFHNFTVTTCSLSNLPSIPVLKFYDSSGGYAIFSAQYGFPIKAYNFSLNNNVKYHMNLTLNFVKPLPHFISTYTLYEVSITYTLGKQTVNEDVYVISPHASFSYINTEFDNQSVSELSVLAKGYATIILPELGFPFTEPTGNIFVNHTEYVFGLKQQLLFGYLYYKTQYYSVNNTFMSTMLGHYYVIFVPNGGNVTIQFDQGNITQVSSKVISSNETNWEFIAEIASGIVVLLAIAVYFLKIRK